MRNPNIYILLFFVILISCSKQSDRIENKTPEDKIVVDFSFPEQSSWTKSILDTMNENLVKIKQEEFILYYKNGSYSDKNKDFLIDLIYSSIERVKNVLNINQLSNGFYLIMVDSEDEMEKVIGINVKGLASGRNSTAIFTYNSNIRPYFEHELFHLIAYNVWGPPESRLLDEGGAMFADNKCLYYENPITSLNNFLFKSNNWFRLNELINNFNEKAAENDLIAYLESAFIFRYLLENHGSEKLKMLWKLDFTQFKNIYGYSISELGENIEKEFDGLDLINVDWDELMKKGCG